MSLRVLVADGGDTVNVQGAVGEALPGTLSEIAVETDTVWEVESSCEGVRGMVGVTGGSTEGVGGMERDAEVLEVNEGQQQENNPDAQCSPVCRASNKEVLKITTKKL